MILLFDVGNTNIVVGVVEDNIITSTYRLVTNSNLTEDEYYAKLEPIIKNRPIEGIAISSVVPQVDHMIRVMSQKYFNIQPLVVGPGVKSGMKIKIENPKQLGADLLCDAVGAKLRYNNSCIIVDLGTASKFIVANQNSEFLGGAISPGIMTSLSNMINSAAKLSNINVEIPKNVIGNDTQSCIQSGVVYGFASMIDGMVNKIIKELNTNDYTIILTGGLSKIVKDVLTINYEYIPNLLLEGLLSIYNRNN